MTRQRPTEPTGEQQALSVEQRRKNVHEVEAVEKRLGELQDAVSHLAYKAASLVREVHAERGRLRRVLGQPALPPVAQLFTENRDNGSGNPDA